MPSQLYLRRILGFVRVVFFVSGTCCLVLSAIFAIARAFFIRNAIEATGSVVRLEERFNADTQSVEYAPVFGFVAKDGRSYTIPSQIATSPPEFVVGDTVRVLYPRNNPQKARIASFWQFWFLPVVLALVSAAHGCIVSALVLFERRWNRRGLSPVKAAASA
jgi:hypothetical protein